MVRAGFSSFVSSFANVRPVGQCRVPLGVVPTDCRGQQLHSLVVWSRRCPAGIGQSMCCSVSSRGVVVASSVAPSKAPIPPSSNIIFHRVVTVVDLGFVSMFAHFDVGGCIGISRSHFCSIGRCSPRAVGAVSRRGCSVAAPRPKEERSI